MALIISKMALVFWDIRGADPWLEGISDRRSAGPCDLAGQADISALTHPFVTVTAEFSRWWQRDGALAAPV
jgi:uncharacterized lipoprotein